MFKVGDEVRLNKGWTRMVVIQVKNNGDVKAKYDSESYSRERRVSDEDFKNPAHATNTYTRNQSGFTAWDGAKATEVFYKMGNQTAQYRLIEGPDAGTIGTYHGITAGGRTILEFPNGHVAQFPESAIEEVVDFTFEVRGFTNPRYTCSYRLPAEATKVKVGNILMSSSGNLYIVKKIHTRDRNPKKTFSGCRVVTESL